MGNCCRSPAAVAREDVKSSNYSGNDHGRKDKFSAGNKQKPITVLTDVKKENVEERYLVDRELGRGEFGITYLCIDRSSRELLACKSISKRKLRTAVDVEDVRREVAIMKHLPQNSSIVSFREACEDENAVHLVMELCEGGELFDRIVARGHYTERAAAAVTRTIVEVVQLCHKHGVIHRDLKPENFLFANKKENSPLKAIDFGLSIFFKPGKKENFDWSTITLANAYSLSFTFFLFAQINILCFMMLGNVDLYNLDIKFSCENMPSSGDSPGLEPKE